MEQYVIRNIIRPLHDALLYGAENAHELKDRLIFAVECAGGNWYSQQHGNLMQSYFEDYLYCDTGLQGPDMYPIRQVLCRALALDRYFYAWVEAEGALIESADAWARHHKEVCEGSIDFICMLRSLSATCYECRCPVGADEMRSVLVREKKEGNAYSREVYCMFHAFVAIWSAPDMDALRKQQLLVLVTKHWNFIRALYSAMLQRVVGYGFSELAAVVNNIKSNQRHAPYVHLLYAAVEEHRERIIRSGTKAYNLDRAMKALREVVVHTEPSAELDEVVGIIFFDRLKEYLEHHQPKSYRELETELHTLRSGMDERTRQIQTLMAEQAEMLRQMAETSVSIEVITEELLRLPAGTAYGVYEKLNALLQKDEVWRNHADNIRDRVLEHEKNYHNQLYFNAPVGTVVAHADRVIGKDEN